MFDKIVKTDRKQMLRDVDKLAKRDARRDAWFENHLPAISFWLVLAFVVIGTVLWALSQ